MSTRCQIKFISEGKEVLIYRHSDGYPEGDFGVVNSISKFLKWDSRGDDIEYIPANFIFFEKVNMALHFNENREVRGENPITLNNLLEEDYMQLGYGVCQPNDYHGDIEFLYTVDIEKRTLTVQSMPKFKIIEEYAINENGDMIKQ